jgi:O-antigen/teichoic acid export membrane protein
MKKNVYIYIITGILTQGLIFVLWIILPMFHKPEILGEYNLMLFYIELVSTFAVFGGDAVILRYYFSDFKKTEVFGSVFWTFIFTFLIFITIIILMYFFFNNILHLMSKVILGLLILNIFFNSMVNLILIHYISIKLSNIYRNLQIFKTVIFFISVLMFSYFSFGIISFFIANIIALSIIIIYHFYENGFSYYQIPKRYILNKTILYGAPLAMYSAMGVVTIYSSRLFINSNLSLELLGIFGFFNIITNQINGIWSSFNKAWTPEVFTKISNERSTDFVFESLYFVVFIYLCLLLVGVFIGKLFLFEVIFQIEYVKYIDIFIILLFYPLITSIYTILYPLFYFVDRTVLVMKISILVAIISVFITWLLTKKFGLYGATFSLLISSLCNLVLYLFFFRKQLNMNIQIIKNLTIIFLCVWISLYFLIQPNGYYIFLIFIFFSAAFIFIKGGIMKYFNKNIFKTVINE